MATADDLNFLLFRQDNVISRRQALRWFTPAAIRNRVQRGRWQVVHRGVYLTGGAHIDLDVGQRRWIASLSAGCGRPMPLGGVSRSSRRGCGPSASAGGALLAVLFTLDYWGGRSVFAALATYHAYLEFPVLLELLLGATAADRALSRDGAAATGR